MDENKVWIILIITIAVVIVTLAAIYLNRRFKLTLKKDEIGVEVGVAQDKAKESEIVVDVAENIKVKESGKVNSIDAGEINQPLPDSTRISVAKNAEVEGDVGSISGPQITKVRNGRA